MAPKVENRNKMEHIKQGWAIPEFININDVKNNHTIKILDITKNILPGMKYSKNKAIKLLDNNNSESIKNHLYGCIYMYDMHKQNFLTYNIVKIIK